MSTGHSLPPQAYTREILAVAFNWLQNQPESVRRQAVTPDALVGLYMRAQRFGGGDSDGLSFADDLRDLSGGVKSFDDGRAGAIEESRSGTLTMSTEYTQRAVHFNAAPIQMAPVQSMATPPPAQPSSQTLSQPMAQPVAPSIAQPQAQAPSHQAHAHAYPPQGHPLDDQSAVRLTAASLKMTSEIRERMNLSSDVEAANMMIAVAYKTLQNLLR